MGSFGYGGTVDDCVKKVLACRGSDAERTLKYCGRLARFAGEHDDAGLLGFASYYEGETYYLLNDGENFFQSITKAVSCLERSKQWELLARAYNILAIASVNRGNEPIAMDYYLMGLSVCKKYELYEIENMIRLNLGNLYLSNGQYVEAQKYFEGSLGCLRRSGQTEDYYAILTCIYVSLGSSYMLRGMTERAQSYVRRLQEECLSHIGKTEQLYALCFQAQLYHRMGQIEQRDACICTVCREINADMAVMDVFDDFYRLCGLLLEIGCDEGFLKVSGILEQLVKQAKMVNLQKKMVSLQIRYYRKNRDHDAYFKAAGVYYELSEMMERENQYIIANMLGLRSSLERANEKRREVEADNIRLQEKSETDALTQLPNRFRLNEYSETAFERAKRGQKLLAMEILDIDYFKQYNDHYGHQAGDACITAIAGQLAAMQNDRIFCARYGGDEFIIIYEDMTEAEVYGEAERLRERIMGLKLKHDYSEALDQITISQGICCDVPGDETKSWDFLHTADRMLYQVKEKNRNGIAIGHLDGPDEKEHI